MLIVKVEKYGNDKPCGQTYENFFNHTPSIFVLPLDRAGSF